MCKCIKLMYHRPELQVYYKHFKELNTKSTRKDLPT